jgi:hypothetical protein
VHQVKELERDLLEKLGRDFLQNLGKVQGQAFPDRALAFAD